MDAASPTILLIEDSPEDRATLRRFLTRQTAPIYTLIEAADAAEGLRLWHEHQPDCVLLDLLLPYQEGLALLAEILRAAPDQPVAVVVLTGLDDTASAVEALTSGAQEYLLKQQLTPAELQRAIANALEKARLQRAHQQSVAALRASEQRLRLFEMVATNIHEALLITEAEPIDQPGPRIVYVNPAFTRMTGYTAEEVIGATPRILQGPKTARRELARIRAALRRWKPVRAEMVNYRKDGSEFEVEFDIVPLADETGCFRYWVSVQRDVTSHKRAERERKLLLAQEHAARIRAEQVIARLTHLHALTTAMTRAEKSQQIADILLSQKLPALTNHAGVLGLITPDNAYLEIVQRWGYSEEVAAAWPTVPLDMRMPLPDAIRAGEPIWLTNQADATALYPALGHIWPASQSWAVLPLWDHQRIIGAWGISFATPQPFGAEDRDFLVAVAQQCAQAIVRVQLYEAALRARATAEAAVESRDQFLAMATHELKNPLTTLLGFAQLVQRRAAPNTSFTERDQRAINTIVEQAMRLNKMLTSLFDVSRLEIRQMQLVRSQVDLVALAGRILEGMRLGLTTHTLVFVNPNTPVLVDADAMRLEQVIQNLIANAIKYSPAGGTITVQITQRGAHAQMSVEDHGIGIPAEKLPQVFQRFYRVANSETERIGGSGVGLYIVKEIVALHQGEVTVESVEGQGSTFTVQLPLAAPTVDMGTEKTQYAP